MKTLVLFYSFTGNTKRLAELLSKTLDAELCEVTCNTYSYGAWGGLKQAWHFFTGGVAPVEMPKTKSENYDLIVIGGPVWGARPSPPVRALLKIAQEKAPKLAIMLSCDGTSQRYPGEKAMDEIVDAATKKPVATRLFKNADMAAKDLDKRVGEFAEQIKLSGAEKTIKPKKKQQT